MPLFHKDVSFPQDDLPVGYFRNAIPHSFSFAQTPIPIMPTSGSSDTTQFSPFFISTDGVYDLSYILSSYVSGSVQEAIFKYKPDLLGVGDTILNQNWASPSNSTRVISGVLMMKGYYWICLRVSTGGQASTYTNTTNSSAGGAVDMGFYTNRIKLNGQAIITGAQRCFLLYDNSVNPAVVITSNGSLSDFSPYQNVTNKYLSTFGAAPAIPHIRIKTKRVS
jgi:hypothetical protein